MRKKPLEIYESISPEEIEGIVNILKECGAVLPLTVWSDGFVYLHEGVSKGGIAEGQQNIYTDYAEAARQYMFFEKSDHDPNVKLLTRHRIVDSSDRQVLPRV